MAKGTRDTERNRLESRPEQSDPGRTGIVSDRAKRTAMAVLGGALLVRGLRRRSLRGVATVIAGGWLLSRALGGLGRPGEMPKPRLGADSRDDEGSETFDATEVSRSITIGRPADELYEAWRDPDQFSQVVGHFAEVTSTDGERFHWTAHVPGDRNISWETRIVEAEPGEFVRWGTPEDAMLPNEGEIRFRPAPGDRGTVVTLTVSFDPPGGTLGNAVLRRLDVVPKAFVGTALGRFKSLVESGEIQTLAGNPSARGSGDLL